MSFDTYDICLYYFTVNASHCKYTKLHKKECGKLLATCIKSKINKDGRVWYGKILLFFR